MLKWAVAKEDQPSSKTKSSTKSLKKRRKLSHHHHYCSILKSGVCLRIENVASSASAKKVTSSATTSSLLPPTTSPKVVEDRKSCNKLSDGGGDGSSGGGASNTKTNHKSSSIVNYGRVQRSSSTCLKVARHFSANNVINNNCNMGNSVNTLVKKADSNEHDSPSRLHSKTEDDNSTKQCTACPVESLTAAISSTVISPNKNPNNNNNSNRDNNISKGTGSSKHSHAGSMIQNNAKNKFLSSSSPHTIRGSSSSNRINKLASNNVGGGSNADSKSLLYMSLDHLPLAIVKQYERMLQESNSVEEDFKIPSEIMEAKKKKVQVSSASNADIVQTRAESKDSVVVPSSNQKIRPSIMKNNQDNISNQPKKITIISPPKSKKGTCSIQTETISRPSIITSCNNNNNNDQKQSRETASSNIDKRQSSRNPKSPTKSSTISSTNDSASVNINIKEARSRPLRVHASNSSDNTQSKTSNSTSTKTMTSPKKREDLMKRECLSSEVVNEKFTQTANSKLENSPKPRGRFRVTVVQSPTASCNSNTGSISDKTKARVVNEVERKDASCETEPKLFPLKSILKDCKSSTLPRSKSEHLKKPKKKSSSSTSSSSTSDDSSRRLGKNSVAYGRSNSFRHDHDQAIAIKNDIMNNFSSPVSSRKIYQSLNNISTIANYGDDEENDMESMKHFRPVRKNPKCSTISEFDQAFHNRIPILAAGKSAKGDHDTTDPQFLELPVPISTPAVSRRAKKLTLKRSELRKLEKIRTQTEKLNRFLKKYYQDCLPLVEEEEEQCSPEEKSVHLSVLRANWIEKKPEEFSTSSPSSPSGKYLKPQNHHQRMSRQRRNTLPHTNLSTAAAIEEAARVLATARSITAGESLNQNADRAAPSTNHHNNESSQDNAIKRINQNSSLLSSSAYYSDPVLSALPVIIGHSEVPTKQKQQKYDPDEHKISAPSEFPTRSASILISNNSDNEIIPSTPSSCSTSSLNNFAPAAADCKEGSENGPCNRSCTSTSTESSCSCSCSSLTPSKCSSTRSSIINLANEFRMAEVIRHDNNIHESFLMSSHNFPFEDSSLLLYTKEFGGATKCIPTVNDENSEELEQALRSDCSRKNNDESCESRHEIVERVENIRGGGNNIDSFAIAPAIAYSEPAELCKEGRRKSDNNNNNREEVKGKNKRSEAPSCKNNGSKNEKVMVPFGPKSCNSVGSSRSSNSNNNDSRSGSCANSINSVDEETHGIIGEAPDHCFGQEKLKGFATTMMMMSGEEEPLGNNNPFDVPTSLAEDEGFMSPYPPEAYSPASSSSSSNASLLNRLSISSGKGSAEDCDERRLELFFLDSSCETSMMIEHRQQITPYKEKLTPELIQIPGGRSYHHHRLILSPERGHDRCEDTEITFKAEDADEIADNSSGKLTLSYNNYRNNSNNNNQYENSPMSFQNHDDEYPDNEIKHRESLLQTFDRDDGAWNSHDYATIMGCSSNSSTSGSNSTYAACGSFFPNSNLLENHHKRQISSDSSSVAFSLLTECENNHNQHHLCHRHVYENHLPDHLYDEVAPSSPNQNNIKDNDLHTETNSKGNELYDEVHQSCEEEEGEEESVIIQSSAGISTGVLAGIAFSTPIRPRMQAQNDSHLYRQLITLGKNNSNVDGSYSQCSSTTFAGKSSCSYASNRSISTRKQHRYNTPRKVVRKPPVKTPYSEKGEVLIRCYRNGDYVTVHVVQARSLQISYRSSWKLSMKISIIPEGEATFTKSDSVVVPRARRFVRIDQKFSFEVPQGNKFCVENNSVEESIKSIQPQRKLFVTFVKRIEKRSSFLGWLSLELPETERTTQCWLKLRKRKMSSVSYVLKASRNPNSHHSNLIQHHHPHHQSSHPPPQHQQSVERVERASSLHGAHGPSSHGAIAPKEHGGHSVAPGGPQGGGETMVGLPPHIEALEQGVAVPAVPSRSCKSPDSYPQEYIGKQLQNSSTMDSGVEDCCEPPPVPSIELDEKLGFRVRVHMTKPEGAGFGFSVVWVSPPRIERLEKDKTADLAGLKIGDLIIGVNGEDVTTVPNTTIYNKMKSTGMELDLEVWRKHPHVASPLPPHLNAATKVPQSINPASCAPPQVSPPNLPGGKVGNSAPECRVAPPPNPSTTITTLPQAISYKDSSKINATSGLPNSSNQGGGNSSGGVEAVKNPLLARLQAHPPPPTSILKPPPPAPPASSQKNVGNSCPPQSQQPTTASSSWRIRFNIELLDNEDDNLKQFFICELKFFRKVVAALDRYLIPAQAKRLLTPQEIHLIFAQVIKIITMTKRILQCVANGSTSSSWKLGRILLSTHSDHLPDITSAYTAYARNLAYSAVILSEKMSIKEFAKFVVETPVPKGHLDMTSLLFAPFEHLRNLCEIGEEICHQHDNWLFLHSRLKECYADIVCETDFMEPISHISMKKNPLLSVRDLEKRIISTTSQQPLKVSEKGRKWLFGSRLYRRENDGSWSPVWAFLFTDIIVLTSHMTRDRVFFAKDAPIRLDDVVTIHFNLPKKHENEFRLLFGPETSHHSRLDRILPLVRNKKPNQVVFRTANQQLKSLWKLLLQRQIISLNTRLSKSSSSNFSISEFCEKFPVVQHDSIIEEEDEEKVEGEPMSSHTTSAAKTSFNPPAQVTQSSTGPQTQLLSTAPAMSAANKPHLDHTSFQQNHKSQPLSASKTFAAPGTQVGISSNNVKVREQPQTIREITQSDQRRETQNEKTTVTSPTAKPYVPDGFSSLNKDLLTRAKVIRPGGSDRRPSIPPSGGQSSQISEAKSGEEQNANKTNDSTSAVDTSTVMNRQQELMTSAANVKATDSQMLRNEAVASKTSVPGTTMSQQTQQQSQTFDNLPSTVVVCPTPPIPKARTSLSHAAQNLNQTPTHSLASRTSTPGPLPESCSPSPIPSHNNNNTIDNVNHERKTKEDKCPCEKIQETQTQETGGMGRHDPKDLHQPIAYPSPKPRQLSHLRKINSREESTQTTAKLTNEQPCQIPNNIDIQNKVAIPEEAHIANGGDSKHVNSTAEPKVQDNDGKQFSDVAGNSHPVMVKRAQSLASGTATPSSSSSLSPARLPPTTKDSKLSNDVLNESHLHNSVIKSKPGSRIMTNAILKSRQQELMAHQTLKTSSVSTETLRTEKSSDTTTASTSKTDSSTQYFSLKEESTSTSSGSSQSQPLQQQIMVKCIHNKNIVVHHQHHSHHCPGGCSGTVEVNTMMTLGESLTSASPHLSVPPRCHSEIGHHSTKKSKPVHTDSPIIGGYGSERARRRMMFDNKLKKDYPELFGITPKDRRSFIKQLGETDLSNKGLVAPYYYTSPVPIPKHVMMAMGSSNNSNNIRSNNRKQGSESDNGNVKPSPFVIPPYNPSNSHVKALIKSNDERKTNSTVAHPQTSSITTSSLDIISVSGSSKNTAAGTLENCTTFSAGDNVPQVASLHDGTMAQKIDAAGTTTAKNSNALERNSILMSSSGQGSQHHTAVVSSHRAMNDNEDRSQFESDESNNGDDIAGMTSQIEHDVYQASLELDEEGQRLKEFVEKMREEMSAEGMGSDEEVDDDDEEDEDDDDDEDSDDSTAGGHEGEHGQSHRSHEESSNDSGISDEMTEKSKTTMSGLLEEDEGLTISISRRNENFSNAFLDRMRSGVLAAEVKFSSNTSSNTTTAVSDSTTTVVSTSNTVPIAIIDLANNVPVVVGHDVGNLSVVDVNNCCSSENFDHANKTQYIASAANHPSHVCNTNSNKSHDVDDSTACYFLEGETKASVEKMVVLKADKATETEEDDFKLLLAFDTQHHNCHFPHTHPDHHHHYMQTHPHPEKFPIRSILAERREAFFRNHQSTSLNASHCPHSNQSATTSGHFHHHSIHFASDVPFYLHQQHPHQQAQHGGSLFSGNCVSGANCVSCNPQGDGAADASHPLIVKIVEGGTLHSVVDAAGGGGNENPTNAQPCERVQLQRLERHKKAKVERVESSEDSTSSSSDLASASPAAENGTTDPSWSSSSSSLAGYASSKEDAVNVSNNNAGSIVTTSAAAASATSSVASTSVSAVVATSTCSHCSNLNNNNNIINNDKDFVCSSSAQTYDEPSSSCQESSSSKSYSVRFENDLTNSFQAQIEHSKEEVKSTSSGSSCCSIQTNDNSSVIPSSVLKRTNSEGSSKTSVVTQGDGSTRHISFASSTKTQSDCEMNMSCENFDESDSTATCSFNSRKPSSNRVRFSTTCSSSRVVVVMSGGDYDVDDDETQDGGSINKIESTSRVFTGPDIVVTQESDPEEDSSRSSNDNGNTRHGYSSDGEEDSIVCNGKAVDSVASDDNGGGSSIGDGGGSGCSSSNRSSNDKSFLRVESNDSTAENYGDDDDYNFDDEDEEDDLSHCSVATINRYGTFESLEKLESDDTLGGLPDFPRSMPRSKARFTFEDDDDDDDDDLFEEDFETDFNFRFPSQIQDNTYSVSRLGPLPPLLEEDYEDEMYDEQRASGVSPSSSGLGEYSGSVGSSAGGCSSDGNMRSRHEVSTMAVQRVSGGASSNNNSPSAPLPPSTTSSSTNSIPRSQKLVVVKSSDCEMIVVAETDDDGCKSIKASPASASGGNSGGEVVSSLSASKESGMPSCSSGSVATSLTTSSKSSSLVSAGPPESTAAENFTRNTPTNTSI